MKALQIAALISAIVITGQRSFATTPQDVLRHYLAVQNALARDSMQDVSANSHALAEAVRNDETRSLPTAIAEQADALAGTKKLFKARQTFKPLSESLIAYLKTNSAPGGYYEVYCPIAKAEWLQAGETVRNPYLGLRSATPTWGWSCAGVVKTKFADASNKRKSSEEGVH